MGKREEIELTSELFFLEKRLQGQQALGNVVKEQTDEVQGDGLFLKDQQK